MTIVDDGFGSRVEDTDAGARSETSAVSTATLARARIGLVLGAGGTTGLAYHAGTLLALMTDTGWDPASANAIVGTSAGSIVGALLRSGVSVDDLAAWGAQVDPLPDRTDVRSFLDVAEAMRHRIQPPALPTAGDVLRSLSSVATHRASFPTIAISAMTFGMIDARPTLRHFGSLSSGWPEDELSIVAVGAGSGRRTVFDQTGSVELGTAVAASCAIPGVFRPIRIGGRRYVDGAVHSPTNADVLVDADIDVAVVLSPMSGPRTTTGMGASVSRGPDRLLRHRFATKLRRECERLSERGIEVIVFEPDERTVAVMGLNALDRNRAPRVLTSAFLGVSPEARVQLRSFLGASGHQSSQLLVPT